MVNRNQVQRKFKRGLSNPFEKLRGYVGQKIRVDYVAYGFCYFREGILKKVKDYVNIEIEDSGIPFEGYGSAIKRVVDEKGNVLYENLDILYDYGVKLS